MHDCVVFMHFDMIWICADKVTFVDLYWESLWNVLNPIWIHHVWGLCERLAQSTSICLSIGGDCFCHVRVWNISNKRDVKEHVLVEKMGIQGIIVKGGAWIAAVLIWWNIAVLASASSIKHLTDSASISDLRLTSAWIICPFFCVMLQ